MSIFIFGDISLGTLSESEAKAGKIMLGITWSTFILFLTSLAICIHSSIKTQQLRNSIVENLKTNNNVDDFELSMVNVRSEYTVDFVGTKTKDEIREFGAYSYTIPHFSEEDLKTYDCLINVEEFNFSRESYSTLEALDNLIKTETATWITYTKQEEKQVKNFCAKVEKEVQEKLAKEQSELTM